MSDCIISASQYDWHRDRQLKAKYNNVLSTTKSRIITLMRENDNIVRLLHFLTPNALSTSNIVTPRIRRDLFVQNKPTTRVFLSNFNEEAIKEARAEIHINFETIKAVDSGSTKIPIIAINVIAANAINDLDDEIGMRHDLLYQEIADTIEGFSVGTIGYLEMVDAREGILKNNTHVIWNSRYKVGEIKR